MILAIIPARGGSKGIPKKNIKLLNGKPLIAHIIETAKKSKYIDDLVVTTDSEEFSNIVSQLGVKVRKRPDSLAADHVTLDPVVVDAYQWYEKTTNKRVDIVITMQPTSPLLSVQTLDNAISNFLRGKLDSMISVVDDTHLFWKEVNGEISPDYKERLNRQWLEKRYKETGAFVISRKELLDEGKRIGRSIGVFEIPPDEAIDIDSPTDWYLASSLLNRMRIKFVLMADSRVGLGHLYRAISLSEVWFGNEIEFLLINSPQNILEIVAKRKINFKNLNNLSEVLSHVNEGDMIINDILDTTEDYMAQLRKKKVFVVNFEDLGEGNRYADLVINELYEKFNPPNNHLYGYEYAVIRNEILLKSPNDFSEKVRNILITFGGSDPSNLTYMTLMALKDFSHDIKIKVKVVLGPSYERKNEVYEYIKKNSSLKNNVEVLENVTDMSRVMENVDLAITSNGRTVYELAAMRIPIISIAQNDRETLHLFARYSPSIRYLGIACNVSIDKIREIVKELVENYEARKKMFDSLLWEEIRKGMFNVVNIIEQKYRRWKYENNQDWFKNSNEGWL